MANRLLFVPKTPNHEMVWVAGSFAPNGSSALDATKVKGKGFTVAYTSTGVYTVTFLDAWYALVVALTQVQLHSAADTQIQVGDYTAASGSTKGTLVLTALTGGSAADIAANAQNRIHFAIGFQNSSIP